MYRCSLTVAFCLSQKHAALGDPASQIDLLLRKPDTLGVGRATYVQVAAGSQRRLVFTYSHLELPPRLGNVTANAGCKTARPVHFTLRVLNYFGRGLFLRNSGRIEPMTVFIALGC
ncbi:hypothetical protein LMG19083_05018 [Ralstonia psammae]|uniref:Secreted protein n=1 Tax=Ralstonia psammae TaxID=3058598 RepID=A0ABM9K1B0_9RALS|nr:hypothetical protein LMG19083_05018 [Ralstonia sp. LMG 19083]